MKTGMTLMMIFTAQSLTATIFDIEAYVMLSQKPVYGKNTMTGIKLINKSPTTNHFAK